MDVVPAHSELVLTGLLSCDGLEGDSQIGARNSELEDGVDGRLALPLLTVSRSGWWRRACGGFD